jgi:nuclear pore complex protein Nup205
MLALSALDSLVAVDYQRSWFSHMSSRGYVQHIIDSLLQDDEQLKNLLHPRPEPLRALYIFQSKIVGSLMLLRDSDAVWSWMVSVNCR